MKIMYTNGLRYFEILVDVCTWMIGVHWYTRTTQLPGVFVHLGPVTIAYWRDAAPGARQYYPKGWHYRKGPIT